MGTGLHTEATVPLGPNRALHLVRAGRELVLVGSAEQGVVPIRTYSEEEARALGLLAPREITAGDDAVAEPARGPGLQAILDRLRERTIR